MKTTRHSGILYILLAIAQAIICNYFRISPYITVSLLPALILCIPANKSALYTMLAAFATGLAVDFFSEGIIGLNTLALVPVAFIRNGVLRMTTKEETIEKGESLSIKYDGAGKVSFAIMIVQALFFAIYIAADGAGVRPLWFNAARFASSMICSYPFALLVVHVMAREQ